jgi:SAM-dependent methyltransferase
MSKRCGVYGIDTSTDARLILEKNGITSWPNLESLPKDKIFSVIRMNWSLEHVHSPNQYFEFIHDHLDLNGIAIITVPNYAGLIYHLEPNCLELPIHLYHFTPKDIIAYAKKNYLYVELLKTFSYPEMYRVAIEAKLINSTNMLPDDFHSNKAILNFHKLFDDKLLGNDMLVVLKK